MAADEMECHTNIRIGRENMQSVGQLVLKVLEECHHIEQFGLLELRVRRSSRVRSPLIDRKHGSGSRRAGSVIHFGEKTFGPELLCAFFHGYLQ